LYVWFFAEVVATTTRLARGTDSREPIPNDGHTLGVVQFIQGYWLCDA
jgi:hypothetical protein